MQFLVSVLLKIINDHELDTYSYQFEEKELVWKQDSLVKTSVFEQQL